MNFYTEEKLPGFAEMDIYLLDEIANWPFVLTDTTSAEIVFAPYENDVEAIIDPDSIMVDVNPRQTAEGETHPISIQFRLLTRSEALEQMLEQYANKPCIAVGKLNNEFKKIYGTVLQPLYMNYSINDGLKADSEAFTKVEVKGETRSRAVYYTP